MKTFVYLIAFQLVFTSKPFCQKSTTPKDSTAIDEDGSTKTVGVADNITFLNAANFDFSDKLQGGYLGVLNLFSPNLENTKFGFNAGIFKVNYYFNDSTFNQYYIENKLIHPLDSAIQGKPYLRQYNKYSSERTNQVWSIYVQPLFRLIPRSINNKEQIKNGIYLHLHAELFINRTNITTHINTLQTDTSFFDTSTHTRYTPLLGNTLSVNKTFLNGYFGAGVTFFLSPFEKSHFFFQPTFGVTTNYPNIASQDISSYNVLSTPSSGAPRIPSYNPTFTGFYLVRAQFQQDLLSENSKIIVGTEIRGIFPNYPPINSTYIGLNLNLSSLLTAIVGKKTNEADSTDASKKETKLSENAKATDTEK